MNYEALTLVKLVDRARRVGDRTMSYNCPAQWESPDGLLLGTLDVRLGFYGDVVVSFTPRTSARKWVVVLITFRGLDSEVRPSVFRMGNDRTNRWEPLEGIAGGAGLQDKWTWEALHKMTIGAWWGHEPRAEFADVVGMAQDSLIRAGRGLAAGMVGVWITDSAHGAGAVSVSTTKAGTRWRADVRFLGERLEYPLFELFDNGHFWLGDARDAMIKSVGDIRCIDVPRMLHTYLSPKGRPAVDLVRSMSLGVAIVEVMAGWGDDPLSMGRV
jgi:hypothetical protein